MSSSVRVHVRTPVRTRVITTHQGELTNSQVVSLDSILGEQGRAALEKVLEADGQWQREQSAYLTSVTGQQVPQALRKVGIEKVEIRLALYADKGTVDTRAHFETQQQQVNTQSLTAQAMPELNRVTCQVVNRVLAQSLAVHVQQQVQQYARQQVQVHQVNVENMVNHRIIAHLTH